MTERTPSPDKRTIAEKLAERRAMNRRAIEAEREWLDTLPRGRAARLGLIKRRVPK